MAELNVQPKKKTSFLPWILILLVCLAALIWFLSKNRHSTQGTAATTIAGNTGNADWNGVDFNVPATEYEEVSNRDISIRGATNYGIYSLGENVLFDEGKSNIRADAEKSLKQVTASINKRYNGGEVRVYGYTDSLGSTSSNKELAKQRADAVKNWMQSNGIDAGRISVNAIGEARPVASNNTEQGRQQNRRVEIVARSK